MCRDIYIYMGFSNDELPITKLAYQLFVQQQKGVHLGNTPDGGDIMGFNCPKDVPPPQPDTQKTWFEVSSNLNNVKIQGDLKKDFKIHRTAPDGECGYHSYLFGIYSNIAGGKYLPGGAGDDAMALQDLCTLVAGDNGRPIPAAQITLSPDISKNLEKLYFDGLEGVIGTLGNPTDIEKRIQKETNATNKLILHQALDAAKARPELANKATFDTWKESPKGQSAARLNVHGIRGIKTLDEKGYLNIKFEKHVLQRLKFLTYNNIIQKSKNFFPDPAGAAPDQEAKLVKIEGTGGTTTPLRDEMLNLINKITEINKKILSDHQTRKGWVEVFGNPDTIGAPDAQASGLVGESWEKSRSNETGSPNNGVGPLVSSYYMTNASESQHNFELRQFAEVDKPGPIDLGWRQQNAENTSYPVYVDYERFLEQSKLDRDPRGMKYFEKTFMTERNIIELNEIAKKIDVEVNKIIAAGLDMSVVTLTGKPFDELMRIWYAKCTTLQAAADSGGVDALKKLEWITRFCSPQKTTFTSFYKLLVSDGGNDICTSPGWYDIDIGQQFYYAFRTPQCYMTCESTGEWRSVGYNNIKKLSAENNSFSISNEAIIGSNGSTAPIYPVMLLNNANHFSAMTTIRNRPQDKIFSFVEAAPAAPAGADAADAAAEWVKWHTQIIVDIIATQFVGDGVENLEPDTRTFHGTVVKNNDHTLSFVGNDGKSHLININSGFAVGIGEPIHIGNPIMTPQAFIDALLRRMIAKEAERNRAELPKGANIDKEALTKALNNLKAAEEAKLQSKQREQQEIAAAIAAAAAGVGGPAAGPAAAPQPLPYTAGPAAAAEAAAAEAAEAAAAAAKAANIPPNISEIFYQNGAEFKAPVTQGKKIFYISYLETTPQAYHPTCRQLGTLEDYADCLYNKIVTVAIEISYIEASKAAENATGVEKAVAFGANALKTNAAVIGNLTPVTRTDYVKAAFKKFKEKNTDVFHSEIDEWLRVINGNYGTKTMFGAQVNNDKDGTTQEDNSEGSAIRGAIFQNREEYINPFRNDYEKSEKSGKVDSKNDFITHINSPNEISYYKKINISKSLDWMGSTSATPFNFFIETTIINNKIYKGGGLTIMLLKELIPSTTTAWWDVNLQELKIGIITDDAEKRRSFKAAAKSVLQVSNEALKTRFNIKPKLVALMASNSENYNIPQPIPVLYNLKVNGINADYAISESILRDTYEYAYDKVSSVYPPLNNAINAQYLAHKFMSINNDVETPDLIAAKKFLFPAKFAKEDTQSASSKAVEDRYKESDIVEETKKAEEEKGRALTVKEQEEINKKSKISQGEITRLKREASSTESVASINSNTRERNLVGFKKINTTLISILDSNITNNGENCNDQPTSPKPSGLPKLKPPTQPPYERIVKFPFPPHLFQEFNSKNDNDLLFNENSMFVKKTRPAETGSNIFESTQCLATGDDCVGWSEKSFSKRFNIPLDQMTVNKPFDLSGEILKERNDIIHNFEELRDEVAGQPRPGEAEGAALAAARRKDTTTRARTRKALVVGACAAANTADIVRWGFHFITLGKFIDKKTAEFGATCDGWWDRAKDPW